VLRLGDEASPAGHWMTVLDSAIGLKAITYAADANTRVFREERIIDYYLNVWNPCFKTIEIGKDGKGSRIRIYKPKRK